MIYELFNAPNIMAVAFTVPPLLNLNPLPLPAGDLYPGAKITHLGGDHTSAAYYVLDFDEPLVYHGLFHPETDPPGSLALFRHPATEGKVKAGFVEWYYCYHWLDSGRCFMWTSTKNLSGRVVETERAVWENPG